MTRSGHAQALKQYRTVTRGFHNHYNAGRPSLSAHYHRSSYNATYTAHGIVFDVEVSPSRAYFIDTLPLPKQALIKDEDPERGLMNFLRKNRFITFLVGGTPLAKPKSCLSAIDADAHIIRDIAFRFHGSPRQNSSCPDLRLQVRIPDGKTEAHARVSHEDCRLCSADGRYGESHVFIAPLVTSQGCQFLVQKAQARREQHDLDLDRVNETLAE